MATIIYQVRVKGHLSAKWAAMFDGMALANETDGSTSITGPLPDQSALYGLLLRMRDLGLELIYVVQKPIYEKQE